MKKIDRVIVTNFKKFDQLALELKGRHVMLVGANGAGKSSVIDAIKRTLGMKGKLLEEPVRQGEDNAVIKTYVMDNKDRYCLAERFKRGGKSRISFYRVNGSHEDELNPPLERFQQIFGKPIDFTPLLTMNGEQQFDYLKENLGLDVSTYEHNYEAIYEDRTQVGREVNALKAQVNDPGAHVYENEIAEYSELKQLDSVLGRRVNVEPLLQERSLANQMLEKIQTVNDKIVEIDRKIEELQQQILVQQAAKENCEKWLETHPKPDTTEIDRQIEDAKQQNLAVDLDLQGLAKHNEMVGKVQAFLSNKKKLEEKQSKYKELTERLAGLDGELNEALKSIDLETIVPGLKLVYEVGPDPKKPEKTKVLKSGLEYNGLPFNLDQQSYGQSLKVIIQLAAHFNADKLNFIPITNWNELDDEGKQEVLNLAKENPDLNIQFAIEKVDNNKQIITEIIES